MDIKIHAAQCLNIHATVLVDTASSSMTAVKSAAAVLIRAGATFRSLVFVFATGGAAGGEAVPSLDQKGSGAHGCMHTSTSYLACVSLDVH